MMAFDPVRERKPAGPILTQSLFTTVHAASSSWRSHTTSTILHSLLALALLMIAIPAMQQEITPPRSGSETVTLIAPPLPEYRYQPRSIDRPPTTAPRPVVAPVIARPRPTPEKVPPIQPAPVAVSLSVPQPVVIAAAPPDPKDVHPTTAPKPLMPQTSPVLVPKPIVRTGSFESAEKAIGPKQPAALKVGGFGDPNSALPAEQSRPSVVAMARLGSFDKPEGSGQSGGGGNHALTGSVRTTGFDSGDFAGSGRAPTGSVRQTAFDGASNGESSSRPQTSPSRSAPLHTGAFNRPIDLAAQAAPSTQPKPVVRSATPVEILSKPTPVYTSEARNLQVQGQVALEVLFQSDGSLRILRVLQGLGHGLDEAAKQAALQVRFRPATRGGVPVDSSATIRITFRLS